LDGTKEGSIMPKNQILVALVALASAMLVFSFWRQILTVILFGVVVVFCYGLYNVTAMVQH
jgi:uncharacterized membrane protein